MELMEVNIDMHHRQKKVLFKDQLVVVKPVCSCQCRFGRIRRFILRNIPYGQAAVSKSCLIMSFAPRMMNFQGVYDMRPGIMNQAITTA